MRNVVGVVKSIKAATASRIQAPRAQLIKPNSNAAATRNTASRCRCRLNSVNCTRRPPSNGKNGSKLKTLMPINISAALRSKGLSYARQAAPNAAPKTMPGSGPSNSTIAC